MELSNLKTHDHSRIQAEHTLIDSIRLFDFEGKKDCLTVSKEIVQDPNFFLKLMQIASNDLAFQQDCR